MSLPSRPDHAPRALSLGARLSLLLGAVLAVGPAAGLGALLLHAETRIRNETGAAMRLARELVETRLPEIRAAGDPRAALARLADDTTRLRHVKVSLLSQTDAAAEPGADGRPPAPDWFLRRVTPPAPGIRIDAPGDTILVAADPADETGEVWQEIVWLAIGALATTLEKLEAENHRLIQRMIQVQDDERRDIARDLHDEMGPFLFAVRAAIGGFSRRLAAADATPDALGADCARIDRQIAALQETNRRILGRLRPAALEEMGLVDALRALVAGWRQTRPNVEITITSLAPMHTVDETTALTAYRVVQEGLTNALRHSDATLIAVMVALDADVLRIDVEDNGRGLPDPARGSAYVGLGLRGLAERVAALDGALTVENAPTGGARLVARLPLRPGPDAST